MLTNWNRDANRTGQLDQIRKAVNRIEAKVFCTEAGRSLADAHGIDLADVRGSGDMKKILTSDVEAMIPDDELEGDEEE